MKYQGSEITGTLNNRDIEESAGMEKQVGKFDMGKSATLATLDHSTK
jgi:hypothetical protein